MTGQMIGAGFAVAGAGYIFGGGLAWLFRYTGLPQMEFAFISYHNLSINQCLGLSG